MYHTHINRMEPHDVERRTVEWVSLKTLAIKSVGAMVIGFPSRHCLGSLRGDIFRNRRGTSTRHPRIDGIDGGGQVRLLYLLRIFLLVSCSRIAGSGRHLVRATKGPFEDDSLEYVRELACDRSQIRRTGASVASRDVN